MEYGQHPQFWIELFIEGDAAPFVFAYGPLDHPSTYHHGWKPPLIKEIGAIERSASNFQGQPEAGILQVSLYDFDNIFKTLFRDDVKGGVLGYELVAYVISRKAAKLGLPPRVIHRGFLNARGLPQGRLATLTSQDAIGAQFGPFGYDKKVPDLLIGPPDFTMAPPAISGKQAVPLIYGAWTDKGTQLEDGTPYVKGRLPAYYVGNFIISSDGTITPVEDLPDIPRSAMLLPPPPAPTYDVVGSPFGGGHTWTFAVEVATAGGWTTLGDKLTIANLPNDGSNFPSGSYLVFHLAEYTSALQAQVTGSRLYVKEGDETSSSAWHFVDAFGEAWGTSGTTGFEVGAEHELPPGDSFTKSWNPPETTNRATIIFDMPGGGTGQRYRGFVVSRAYFEIEQLFASPVNADQTLGEGRVEVPLTSADFIRPGHSNWPIAGSVVNRNNHDYTMFFGFGARADFAMDGRLSVAVNGCGYTQNGTPSTLMIGDVFDQMVRLLNDFIFYNRGQGYQEGPWPDLETFPGSVDVQIINVDSFKICSDYYASKLGRRPKGNIYINQQVSFREVIRQFAQDTGTFIYTDQFGRLSCGIVDETIGTVGAAPLRDRIEIRKMGEMSYNEAGLRNVHDYQYDYDPDLSQYRLPPKQVIYAPSLDFYRRRVEGNLREFKFTHDAEFIEAVIAHDKLLMAFTPEYYPINVSYSPGLDLDINQVVSVTNSEYNFVDRIMLIMGHEINQPNADASVDLICLDIQDFISTVPPPPDIDPEIDPDAPPEEVPEPPSDITLEV